MSDYYENTIQSNPRGEPMKLPPQARTTNPEFHAALIGATSMRAKLAICYHMLSQNGTFSDSGPEVWELRKEVAPYLPESIRSG